MCQTAHWEDLSSIHHQITAAVTGSANVEYVTVVEQIVKQRSFPYGMYTSWLWSHDMPEIAEVNVG